MKAVVRFSNHPIFRLVNGYVFPLHFATVNGNQTFYGNVTFDNDIHMQSAHTVGKLNNVDVQKFSENLINDGGQIFGKKTIIGDAIINGSILSVGKVNAVDVRRDLMFFDTDQEITADKYFHFLDVGRHAVSVVGDVGVVTTVDGVDLSELELSGMSTIKNETVSFLSVWGRHFLLIGNAHTP